MRKPSAKVLEAQQSLRTQTATGQPRQSRTRATASQQLQTEAAWDTQQPTHDDLLPVPIDGNTTHDTIHVEARGRSTRRDDVAQLIASLKDIIVQQNATIESFRTELEDIKANQQYLKNQNAELQETVESLRAQLDTLLVEPPSTQTWASVVGNGRPTGSGTATSRSTGTRIADENKRQLVIDVSRVGQEAADKVANTEAAKQTIQQGMNGVERLVGATVKDFRVWRANDSTSVIKFLVDKDREAAFRQTTAEWLEPHIPGARVVGPKWYPVKADWMEVTLVMDAETGKVSKSAMERFRTENGVEVCMMRWLGRPRPSGQHASVVIRVATKEDAEKLLTSDSVTFSGGGIMVSPFEERRTPVACFKCRRYRHRARDCMRPETCDMCGQEGHLRCKTVNLRCVNCQGPHRASHRESLEYRKEKVRILTR